MLSLRKIIGLLIFLSLPYLSGCAALLIFPAAGIFGHVVQKSNEDYDNIIVNMGYRYKQYYQEMETLNKERLAQGKPAEKILTFEQWMDAQVKNEKEKKAVERYKKIHANSP